MNAKSVKNRSNSSENSHKISLRPILYLGLGGFGCSVIRRMKQSLLEMRPKDIDGFAFLGLDTQRRATSDILSRNEYIELSLGVDPNRVSRENPDQLSWFLDLAGGYRAKSITAGAGMVKAVGRLALRYAPTFNRFISQISNATKRLNKMRDGFTPGEPLKAYVISTLAGGTGAGCVLDVMGVVGKFLRSEIGPDFPYHAILATPDQLQGEAPDVQLPRFRTNTYASLKELHHFIAGSDSPVIDYGKAEFSQMKFDSVNLPNAIHLISDKNERGSVIVEDNGQLADIVVNYLLSDVVTPLSDKDGQPKVQDRENSHMDNAGRDGMPRAFSSFGVVKAGIPIEILAQYYAAMVIDSLLEDEIHEPHDIIQMVANWLNACKLREAGSDQFQDQIKAKLPNDLFGIAVDAKGSILSPGFKYPKLVQRCKKFLKETTRAHENECKKPIHKLSAETATEIIETLHKKIDSLFDQNSVGTAYSFAYQLQTALKVHQGSLSEELSESEATFTKLEKEVETAILDVETASQHFFGRKRQVESAVSNLGSRVELLLSQQSDVWLKQECSSIYAKLLDICEEILGKWLPIRDTLQSYRDFSRIYATETGINLDNLADIGKRGPGNRFSLINSTKALSLFEGTFKDEAMSINRRSRDLLRTLGLLTDGNDSPEDWLDKASEKVIEKEIGARLDGFDLISILDRFYPDEYSIQVLFQDLDVLSLPLFSLDPDREEANYEKYWIVAIHPDMKSEFDSKYGTHLAGEGKCYAESDTKHEVQLFQLKLGYTIHSLSTLNGYMSDYQRAMEIYRKNRQERKTVLPIHCWPDADLWDELFPDVESREAAKWFILGWAFNRLFPNPEASSAEDRKNTEYIYSRGANFYIKKNQADKPILIGNGLDKAFRAFTDRVDWQEIIQKRINKKKVEVGEQIILKLLNEEYIPTLKEAIDTSRNNDVDSKRAAILVTLLNALETYMTEELKSPQV